MRGEWIDDQRAAYVTRHGGSPTPALAYVLVGVGPCMPVRAGAGQCVSVHVTVGWCTSVRAGAGRCVLVQVIVCRCSSVSAWICVDRCMAVSISVGRCKLLTREKDPPEK